MAKKKVTTEPEVQATATVDPATVRKEKVAEAINAEMAEIKDKVFALVKDRNESAQFGEHRRIKKIDDEVSELLASYATLSETKVFNELKETPDPMYSAAVRLTFPTLKVKEEKDKITGDVTSIVVDSSKPIDPLRLHKRVDGGIGHDKGWFLISEKFNLLMNVRKALLLGGDAAEVATTFKRHAEADAVDCLETAKDANNVGADALLADLQTIVTAMIGEGYKVSSQEVVYLLSIYSRKSNKEKLTVTTANDRALRTYLLEICHAVIFRGKVSYKLDYKRA